MTLRFQADWVDRGAWLFALLVLLMLLPAAFVLWFMNEAITNRTAEAERSVQEAYRGQLRLVRARIDEHWDGRAAALRLEGEPATFFARHILAGTADGLVIVNADGTPAYPTLRSRSDASVVRSLQARLHEVDSVAAILNDYETPLSAPDRLALMDRLRALAPNVGLRTQAALRLSTDWVQSGAAVPEPGGLHETGIRGLWALTSDDRRVVALYWTGQLESSMHDFLHEVEPEGIRFVAYPPGIAADAEAIAAGAWLPGWQLSFVPIDRSRFDDRARREVTRYVWVGLAAIALIAGLGATAGRAVRRQMRLTRLKTDLVAAVSHELRTPMTSIAVLVDGLLADAELDPPKTREYLALIAGENARLHRLIENFLTFARLERGDSHFAFSPAHPSDIVAAAVEAIRDRVPSACDLRVDVAAPLPPLMADREALTAALVNLLDNALKYTPAHKAIRVRACRDGQGFVAFEVEDNGIGIPVREQRRIFRRFYRVDQRLARETSGVGLGLSIVDLIVRAHRGTVSVRSADGAGSVFTLRLPCADEGVAA